MEDCTLLTTNPHSKVVLNKNGFFVLTHNLLKKIMLTVYEMSFLDTMFVAKRKSGGNTQCLKVK